jgi:glucose/arabinose dehydrogenase
VRALAATAIAVVGAATLFAGLLARSASAGEADFRARVFARGLDSPVLLTYAPGESQVRYVVEQPGRVLRLQGSRRTVFLDIRGQVEYGGEQGLLGLAFHPKYRTNHLFYVAYTSRGGQNVVARFRSNGRAGVKSSRKILFAENDPYGNHNGGNLAFGPDGMLYTSIGDGGSGGDPENRAQNMSSPFGKLLRLDVDKAGAKWEIAGLGLRNPWRFSFDRATGDLYIGDVGQGSLEEIDFTPAQSPGLENYGWNLYEGSRRYKSGQASIGELVFPVHEYGRSGGNCTVVGGYVYRGRAKPAERGRYVFGDYCTGIVWSLRIKAGAATSVRREPFRISSLSSFGEDEAGELYAISLDGTIYRIT